MNTALDTTAAVAVRSVIDAGDPVSLDTVLERAALQDRTDTKFAVDAATFTRWAGLLTGGLDVLEIDGLREFRYESTYFDTPDRALFRSHRQGCRRRYKVRTRSYLDSAECQLEVKFEGSRASTLKERAPYPFADRYLLSGAGRRHVAGLLRGRVRVPRIDLEVALTNTYRRTTLLLRDAPVRITCDSALRWSGAGAVIAAPRTLLLIEVKAASPRNGATAAFARLGVRPVSLSKYCAGLVLLEPELHANPWRPVLNQHFPHGDLATDDLATDDLATDDLATDDLAAA